MSDTPPAFALENQRLERELVQARAALEDFTYSVSHDLRASLRHINAYVKIINEVMGEQGAPDLKKHLATVSQAAAQMGCQIDALTELSRLARVELSRTVLDCGQMARDTVAALAQTLGERGVEWQIAPDIPAVQADAILTRQVLDQLFSNALKFTTPRPLAIIKLAWAVQSNGYCALTVSDNGVGFNPQYGGKLFQAFQRLHSAREFDGLGMGLARVRKIVERHGGSVWAQGAVGAGCRVSFTLPLAAETA